MCQNIHLMYSVYVLMPVMHIFEEDAFHIFVSYLCAVTCCLLAGCSFEQTQFEYRKVDDVELWKGCSSRGKYSKSKINAL